MKIEYLGSAKMQFEYYKSLGDKTISPLPEDKLFWKYNPESNSIAIIIKHLSGNMISRWTDFLTTDGEKDWRHRDAEFEDEIISKTQLIQIWDKGWDCLFSTLNSLQDQDLSKIVYIRNQGHSVTEAINRQLAHYPYHIGQIVFIGKMICDEKWISLSIPKGNSKDYNAKKFSIPKHNEHFTTEYLTKAIMNKDEIISNLTASHLLFWETATYSLNPYLSRNGKWSVAQNVVHIALVLSRINNYLSLQKSIVKSNFGLSERASNDYEVFIERYKNALANGAKATTPFIPETQPETAINQLIHEGNELLSNMILNLESWTEDELEMYNCPHPVLGKITVREMLYFTIYHVQHHNETIKKII